MPKCLKCLNDFPNKILIGKTVRNLQNRKFCLDCSPFGKHNTRSLVKQKENKVCEICERKFTFDKKQGHQRKICNSCCVRKNQREKKARAVAFYGGKCIKCGYSKCIEALDFHHRDRKEKEHTPSVIILKWAWERVKKELDKCDLLCANCHREAHASEYVEQKARLQAWKDKMQK